MFVTQSSFSRASAYGGQFSVFISHVIKTKNRNRSINKVKIWDMIDDCNINNLAKNQVSAVFNSRAIRRSVSSKFIEICMGRHVGAHLDGHQHGGRKPTETSVIEFYYKSVNLSLEELKNIKIILFLIQEPVQIATFPEISPEISHFLNYPAVM